MKYAIRTILAAATVAAAIKAIRKGDLEPIQHPDTARLNWLENETKKVGDSVHFGHDWIYFHTTGDGCEQENFVDLRASIDSLMEP